MTFLLSSCKNDGIDNLQSPKKLEPSKMKIEFHEFGLSWMSRHLDAEQSFPKEFHSTFDRTKIEAREIEKITHVIYDLADSSLVKIDTYKKRFHLKYEAVIQKQVIADSINYFIDTIPSKWLVERNQLIIDSLLFTFKQKNKVCGTGLSEMESMDFPKVKERKISKLKAEKILEGWLN